MAQVYRVYGILSAIKVRKDIENENAGKGNA